MTDPLEDMQVRFAHQELALEALNDELVRQGRVIAELRGELDRVTRELRELRPSPVGGAEPPPPHY